MVLLKRRVGLQVFTSKIVKLTFIRMRLNLSQYQQFSAEKLKTTLHCPMRSKFILLIKLSLVSTEQTLLSTLSQKTNATVAPCCRPIQPIWSTYLPLSDQIRSPENSAHHQPAAVQYNMLQHVLFVFDVLPSLPMRQFLR